MPAALRVQRESIILKWHRRRIHCVIEGLVVGGTDDPSRLCGLNYNAWRSHAKQKREQKGNGNCDDKLDN